MRFGRQYCGDILLVNCNCLSKYNSKKVRSLGGAKYAPVRIEKDFKDGKVKVGVYYYDIPCVYYPVNFIGDDIIEKKDIEVLDWDMAMKLHNNGDKYIIENYLRSIELYNTSCLHFGGRDENGNRDDRVGVYKWPDAFDEKRALFIADCDWFEHTKLITDWMIEQVTSGKVNLDDHIKNLKQKYNIK